MFNAFSSTGLEERLLTVSAGHLLVFKPYPRTTKYSLFSRGLPTDPPMGIVKSVTELSRLFKIDILAAMNSKAKNDMELVLHFVNKDRDPMVPPTIKHFVI